MSDPRSVPVATIAPVTALALVLHSTGKELRREAESARPHVGCDASGAR